MQALNPFQSFSTEIQLSGSFQCEDSALILNFSWLDPGSEILGDFRPKTLKKEELSRRNNLWTETCFEAFISPNHRTEYWEINLSPSGQWNLYKFDSYRSPQPPTENFDFELLELVVSKNHLRAALREIPSRLNSDNSDFWEGNLCAVLKTTDRNHYYSCLHSAQKPDFHLRESFKIKFKL